MKIIAEELGALVATMTVEDCIVADGDFGMQPQIMDTLVRVFHALSLTNVAHHTCIKTLHLELQSTDSESILWLKGVFFCCV